MVGGAVSREVGAQDAAVCDPSDELVMLVGDGEPFVVAAAKRADGVLEGVRGEEPRDLARQAGAVGVVVRALVDRTFDIDRGDDADERAVCRDDG